MAVYNGMPAIHNTTAAGRGRKRRASSDSELTVADVPSKKRLCFPVHVEATAMSIEGTRKKSSVPAMGLGVQQEMADDTSNELVESLSGLDTDPDVVSAVADLLFLRRSSSSDSDFMEL